MNGPPPSFHFNQLSFSADGRLLFYGLTLQEEETSRCSSSNWSESKIFLCIININKVTCRQAYAAEVWR